MKQVRRNRLFAHIATITVFAIPSVGIAQSRTTMAARVAAPAMDAKIAAGLRKFAKLSDRRQEAVLAGVRGAVSKIDDPFIRSLVPYGVAGGKSARPRHKPLRVSKKRSVSETSVATSLSMVEQLPFRARFEFRFAYGDIVSRTPVAVKKRMSKRKKLRMRMQAELEDLLAGHGVDSDLALAAILRELDVDRSADTHAVFLDSWHNGAETFYQALERTAGSGQGVFCYDAMLSDWVRRCVPKAHADRKAMIRSSDATQAAFYRTAATYRAYRSVRELVALSLILPPDVRLPEQLAKRYEDNGGGAYSTRDVVEILLAAHGNDIAATVRTILKHLKPMPADPWKCRFNSVQGLYDAQAAVTAKVVGRDSDQLLVEQKANRRALRQTIADVSRGAFFQALAM